MADSFSLSNWLRALAGFGFGLGMIDAPKGPSKRGRRNESLPAAAASDIIDTLK